MALINCPECNREISDRAGACPHCGFPIKSPSPNPQQPPRSNNPYAKPVNYDTPPAPSNNNPYYHQDSQQNIPDYTTVKPYVPKKHYSPLGIAALAFSILGLTFVIGAILAIIDIRKADGEDKKLSWYAIGVCCLWLLIFMINAAFDPKEETANEAESKQEVAYYWDEEDESNSESSQQEESIENHESKEEMLDAPNVPADPIIYEDVFFYTLIDNIDSYNGQYVRTVIEVSSCYESENGSYIRSGHADSTLSSSSADITVYPDNYQKYERGDYITVEGRVAKENYNDALVNAHIVNCGSEAKSKFDSDLSICKAAYNERLQQEKDSFIASCIDVSYEDLRRYPESYENVPIRIKIYADDVEPDGWIFPGDIIATVGGEELAVYDDRIVREPRIVEGDTITVYAIGYGLSTIKVKQKGLVFNKTVDEYNVPAIKIKYTEKDNDFFETNE